MVDEVVDDDVLFDHALGQFAVVGEQGVRRAGDRLADQGKNSHDLGMQVLAQAYQGQVGRRPQSRDERKRRFTLEGYSQVTAAL